MSFIVNPPFVIRLVLLRYTDIIYFDACSGTKLEEVSCANMFLVEPDRISTPSLGTILPGITREAVGFIFI